MNLGSFFYFFCLKRFLPLRYFLVFSNFSETGENYINGRKDFQQLFQFKSMYTFSVENDIQKMLTEYFYCRIFICLRDYFPT